MIIIVINNKKDLKKFNNIVLYTILYLVHIQANKITKKRKKINYQEIYL
jgi:hypothetical protein